MDKLRKYIYKCLFKVVMLAAIVSVNITCNGRYYQEEMDEQLNDLRKYTD